MLVWATFSAVTTPLPKVTYAYSWTEVDSKLGNIVPFYWLKLSELSNLDAAVAQAKTAANSMPEGHRVLFSWDLHWELSYHPSDALTDSFGNKVGYTHPNGYFTPYQGIWWDHGVDPVKKRFDDFFREYASIGGKVEVVVLDFEEGFTNWHLKNKATREYDGNIRSYLLAIQNDPRFGPINRELGWNDLLTILDWSMNDNYLKWDALMQARVTAYLNASIYEPIKKYFPQVKMSNYGYYHRSEKFPVPDRNGHIIYKHGSGSHVGTHQSYELYGWMGNVKDLRLDGVNLYDKTPFNAFRYEVNKLRAMKLSADVPVYPWVSYKEFDASLLNQSDLYQELVFHAGLTGVEDFLFWNPTSHVVVPATPTSNKLLSDCLKELDNWVGFDDQKTLVDSLVGWGDNYVLTGMQANGRSIWRLTPKLEKDTRLENMLVREFPATFQIGSKTVTIPNGRAFISKDSISRQGYWVIEVKGKL
jgi:hypothetical protein